MGRHDWNPASSKESEAAIAAECLAPLADAARADPATFLHRLALTCLPAGAWAGYGAERIALRLFGAECPAADDPSWCALLDRSLALHQRRLVPYPLLPDYLVDRYEAVGGAPEDWLPFSEAPEPGETVITPLRPGEVRTVLDGRAGSGLRVMVSVDGDHVIGLVELVAPAGEGAPGGATARATVECWRAHDLYDLYLDIAWAFPFRVWADAELEPFFAGPVPRL